MTSLGQAFRRGVTWSFVAVAAGLPIRLLALLLIARALTPHEFGVAAMAMAVWAVAAAFTDLALSAALVQLEEIDENDRSTAFWSSLAAGAVLAAVGVAASGTIAAFFGEPQVAGLVAALGGATLLNAAASTQVALLTRAMEFRKQAVVSVVATAAAAVSGISLAYAGAGPWAVIAGSVVSAAVGCALLWRQAPWRPQLLFSGPSFRRLFGFSSLLFATRLVVAIHRSVDRFVIGRLLGAAPVGAYALPATIVALPAQRLVDPIRAVLFPAFARLQSSLPKLADTWLRATRLTFALLAPMLGALALAAEDIVELVLTSRWSETTSVLRILSVAALFQLGVSMNAVALSAVGRLRSVLAVFTITAALSSVGVAIGASFGLEAAAAGYAAGSAVVAPFYVALTARTLGLTARTVAGAYLPACAGLAVMAAAVATAKSALPAIGSSAGLGLLLVASVGLGLYTAVVLRLSPAIRRDLVFALSRPTTGSA